MDFKDYKYLVTYREHPYAYQIVDIVNEIKSFNDYNEPVFYFNVSPCQTVNGCTARLDDLIKINQFGHSYIYSYYPVSTTTCQTICTKGW